jgi:CheY-like chemotaxis protein/DNA-binding XRE family transcriptional regulator
METKDVRKVFGSELRRRRKDLGLSQEEFGERANLHRTYVSDVEAGKRNPSLQSMQRLAVAVGASIGSVFGSMEGIIADVSGKQTEGNDKVVDILLVEDDRNDVELTLAAFKRAGLTNQVEVLRDGAEALDFLFCQGNYDARRASNRLQLNLLDLQLPKMSGLEVLRRIKAEENTRTLPVVILTGSRKDEDLQEALTLGAEAYMVKPVDFQNFSRITPKISLHWALIKNGK